MKFRTSYIWAMLVALGVVGWMASGKFNNPMADGVSDVGTQDAVAVAVAQNDDVADSSPADNKPRISAVTVSNSAVRRSVRASGVTRPKAIVTVSAEIAGTATKVPVSEGSVVAGGDVLVALNTTTLPVRIEAAKAEIAAARTAYDTAVEQARGTYEEERAAAQATLEVARQRLEIAQKLASQNFSAPVEQAQLKADYENARMALARIDLAKNHKSEIDISQSQARLATAKSNLAVLRDQLKKSTITAPTGGWLETVSIDAGEQVGAGTPVATILNMDEVKIIVGVPQTDIAQISVGDQVSVDVAGAGKREGIVSRIASITSSTTRTFDVEVTVPNADRTLRAGMSVEATIDVGFQPAFGMSPAHLSVAGDGSLTAKVSDNGIVRVVTVDLVRSGVEQVFVSGLVDGDTLLTFGQAFVEAGDTVRLDMGRRDMESAS
ncbi:MAG: efflux RND transporter periplasmic adaptor subunit [Pseudomonadota bacterium]|nr:efflux RND transporter periplasmic adaptor subunit [Pseudomonadota bacterium]